jgi:cysteinyl-tRNA synthetase
MIEVTAKRTKMSKSKGNVVMVDEASCGIYKLDARYQFRNLRGYLVDHKMMGVWKTPEGDYRTSTSTKRQPVFLHEFDEQIPTLIKGKEQHPEEVAFWANLSKLYEEVHGCPLPKC